MQLDIASLGIIFSPVFLKGWCTAIMHLKWEKKYCENVLCRLGEGRDVVTHNDPHVQFWDKKLEGRMGAGLLLSSGLCRHMVIIWSSFEHAASLLMKRAVVQHENWAANTRANFHLLQKQRGKQGRYQTASLSSSSIRSPLNRKHAFFSHGKARKYLLHYGTTCIQMHFDLLNSILFI